jgi:hypothetical protein
MYQKIAIRYSQGRAAERQDRRPPVGLTGHQRYHRRGAGERDEPDIGPREEPSRGLTVQAHKANEISDSTTPATAIVIVIVIVEA